MNIKELMSEVDKSNMETEVKDELIEILKWMDRGL